VLHVFRPFNHFAILCFKTLLYLLAYRYLELFPRADPMTKFRCTLPNLIFSSEENFYQLNYDNLSTVKSCSAGNSFQ